MTVVRNIGEAPIQHRLAIGAMFRQARRRAPFAARPNGTACGSARASPNRRGSLSTGAVPRHADLCAGDWNQGMTTYSVPHGGPFDLRFVWRAGASSIQDYSNR